MQFFFRRVKWCGGIIPESGIKIDPERMNALLKMPVPKTGDQVQKFLCAVNWTRMAFPRYNELVSPLSAVLEKTLTLAGSRTKWAAAKVSLRDC